MLELIIAATFVFTVMFIPVTVCIFLGHQTQTDYSLYYKSLPYGAKHHV